MSTKNTKPTRAQARREFEDKAAATILENFQNTIKTFSGRLRFANAQDNDLVALQWQADIIGDVMDELVEHFNDDAEKIDAFVAKALSELDGGKA